MNDLETTVRLMSRIGFCTGPSLSPDGSEVAFISDLNGLPQVWRVGASGGWPELVTALEDQVLAVVRSATSTRKWPGWHHLRLELNAFRRDPAVDEQGEGGMSFRARNAMTRWPWSAIAARRRSS